MPAIARSVAGGRRSVRRRNVRLLLAALAVLAVAGVAYVLVTAGPSERQQLQAECAQLLAQAESQVQNASADQPPELAYTPAETAYAVKAQLDGLELQHGITGCPGSG